jgi:uncharacterized membrane protein
MEILDNASQPQAVVHGRHHTRRISLTRAWMAFASLVFASAICVALVLMRQLFVGYASYAFLFWNLTLAWIPLVFSFITYRYHALDKPKRLQFFLCAFAWFVFFPNAPYMVTDFVHISPIHIAPEWLDVITVIACAWTGLCLGYLSLYLMQEIARERFGRLASWVFVLAMLALGSIGVFCGRFLRWNSWDVLSHPVWMLHTAHPIHRFSQPGDMIFLTTLFLFLLLSYCALFALTHLYDRPDHHGLHEAPREPGQETIA